MPSRPFVDPPTYADGETCPSRVGTCCGVPTRLRLGAHGHRPTLHQRRGLAWTIELILDPRAAARRGFAHMPRIPIGNRAAVQEPLRQIVLLLRDARLEIDMPLDDLGLLTANPNSALFEPYPNRARYAADAAYESVAAGARPANAHALRLDATTPAARLAEG